MKGLYIHIPFCEKKCHYCDFVITGRGSAPKRQRFLSALASEMDHKIKSAEDQTFDTLYIGGGTPSALDAGESRKLFELIESRFMFNSGSEKTLEANPGDLTFEKAALYRKAGINRISLGAQSFREETLHGINRAHGSKAISESFKILRDTGFDNISLDLILALPGETLEDVRFSLDKLLELGPEHVSLYELTVEERTVFGRLQKEGKLVLPREETSLQMLQTARQFLKDNGFVHYELLSYAKPGRESKHNLLYWANEEYLGLGPGAFSYLGGRRFRSSSSYEEYLSKIEAGDWTSLEDDTLSPDKKEIESFLLALRLTEGVQASKFSGLISKLTVPLERLAGQELLSVDDRIVRLTPKGQLFAETVFTELSPPYEGGVGEVKALDPSAFGTSPS